LARETNTYFCVPFEGATTMHLGLTYSKNTKFLTQ